VTPVSATRMVKLTVTRITAAIASWLRHLSDRVHQDGDALARQHAWIITATTGRFGFGGRLYRDPRFGRSQLATRRADRQRTSAGWPP